MTSASKDLRTISAVCLRRLRNDRLAILSSSVVLALSLALAPLGVSYATWIYILLVLTLLVCLILKSICVVLLVRKAKYRAANLTNEELSWQRIYGLSKYEWAKAKEVSSLLNDLPLIEVPYGSCKNEE